MRKGGMPTNRCEMTSKLFGEDAQLHLLSEEGGGIESPGAKSELVHLSKESTESLIRTFAAFALWLRSVTSRSGSRYTNRAAVEIVGVPGRFLGPFLDSANPLDLLLQRVRRRCNFWATPTLKGNLL
jgi:hypothetical protein